MEAGNTYRACMQVFNVAGVSSLRVCSNSMVVGLVNTTVSPTEVTTILLSPVDKEVFRAMNGNWRLR
jgi:hypothetical protein